MSFTPTLEIKETSHNVQNFIKLNRDVFWEIFKPLAPFIAALLFLDTLIEAFILKPDPETGIKGNMMIGEILSSYFLTCLIISWHRIVIHGRDHFVPMNPFRPKKNELVFLFMGMAIVLIPIIGIVAPILLGALLKSSLLGLISLPLMVISFYIILKLCFYFPSKATDNNLTLKQSYHLTTGYLLKIFIANIRAAFKIWALYVVYIIVLGLVSVAINKALQQNENQILEPLLYYIIALPIYLYFQPLITIIGITVLSNYYQHALQNKPHPNP